MASSRASTRAKFPSVSLAACSGRRLRRRQLKAPVIVAEHVARSNSVGLQRTADDAVQDGRGRLAMAHSDASASGEDCRPVTPARVVDLAVMLPMSRRCRDEVALRLSVARVDAATIASRILLLRLGPQLFNTGGRQLDRRTHCPPDSRIFDIVVGV